MIKEECPEQVRVGCEIMQFLIKRETSPADAVDALPTVMLTALVSNYGKRDEFFRFCKQASKFAAFTQRDRAVAFIPKQSGGLTEKFRPRTQQLRHLWAGIPLVLALWLSSCGGSGGTRSVITPVQSIPVFTSTPPMSANEGDPYTYNLSATDPSGAGVSYQLVQAPSGASLGNAQITWTPSSQQARSANSFIVKATTSSGGQATQTWTVTPSGTIRGTNVINYVGAQGVVPVPVDLSGTQMYALVPNSSGGFDQIAAIGTAQGTFTIPHVPAGYFWLVGIDDPYLPAVGTQPATDPDMWLWTSKSNIDLGYSRGGRQTTRIYYPLDITATGISPLSSANDWFYLVTPNEGVLVASTLSGTFGSTSVLYPVDPGFAIDPSQGDNLYVIQNSYSPTPVPYYTAVKTSGAVSIAASANTAMTVPMSDPPTTPIEINIKGTQFANLLADLSSSATPLSSSLWVGVRPFGPIDKIENNVEIPVLTYGTGGSAAFPGPAISTDSDFGSVQFGNPFPGTWPTYVHFEYSANIPLVTSAVCQASVFATYSSLPTVQNGLAPVIGPPLNPKIDGTAWGVAGPTIGASPTLSWDMPRLGTPSGFLVQLWTIFGVGGPPFPGVAAQLLTKQTSLTIPTGAFFWTPSNSTIWFQIYAVMNTTGADYESHPGWVAFYGNEPQTLAGASTCSPTFTR